MTTSLSNPAVELLGVPDLHLVETAPPELTRGLRWTASGRR
ncbi:MULTISPECIES: hypothetical protein [unclassified Streptomyces]